MQPYRSLEPKARAVLLITKEVAGQIVVLPAGTMVNETIINSIIKM
jgi:hypothetical protein